LRWHLPLLPVQFSDADISGIDSVLFLRAARHLQQAGSTDAASNNFGQGFGGQAAEVGNATGAAPVDVSQFVVQESNEVQQALLNAGLCYLTVGRGPCLGYAQGAAGTQVKDSDSYFTSSPFCLDAIRYSYSSDHKVLDTAAVVRDNKIEGIFCFTNSTAVTNAQVRLLLLGPEFYLPFCSPSLRSFPHLC
jgi:hypothetical protein